MAVKRIRAVARAFSVLEAISAHQPVGVGTLATLLQDDKSTLQRIIMTLADEGWIRAATGTPTRWELTAHIHTIANQSQGGLRQRVRPALDTLRNRSGESVLLAVPDGSHLVAIDVLESLQLIRTAPSVGIVIPTRASSAGQAMLAFLEPDRQIQLLGSAPDAALLAELAAIRKRGYSLSEGLVMPGSSNIGAAILESDGQPVAAVVVNGPSDRITAERRDEIGVMVLQTARELSRCPYPVGN